MGFWQRLGEFTAKILIIIGIVVFIVIEWYEKVRKPIKKK
jgi:hypothetical protein